MNAEIRLEEEKLPQKFFAFGVAVLIGAAALGFVFGDSEVEPQKPITDSMLIESDSLSYPGGHK